MLLRLQMQADMYAMFDNVQKSLVSFLSIIPVTESRHYNMTFYEFSLNNTLRKAATTAKYCPTSSNAADMSAVEVSQLELRRRRSRLAALELNTETLLRICIPHHAVWDR